VFPAQDIFRRGVPGRAQDGAGDEQGEMSRVVTGMLLDVSPQILVIDRDGQEERLVLGPGTSVWRGGQAEVTSLLAGDKVIARLARSRHNVAEAVWAGIGRVTGTIVERNRHGLLVDSGRTRDRQAVVIAPGSASRIQVRFPQLEPGHLVDLIGVRRGGALEATVPATAQPAYRADQPVRVPVVAGREPGTLRGSATWHEPGDGEDAEGVAYPAIDPSAGCHEDIGPACCDLPYLAVGSMLQVRNECTGAAGMLPVTGCGVVARLFCDRCLTCGTSPRGRIADLTATSFAALGGGLERGCFNATIAMGH
jgi:hypothetical protein